MRKLTHIGVVVALVALSGCATTRSQIHVNAPPDAEQSSAPTDGARTVLIRAVTDDREFAEAPSDPSTPSLGSGGASNAPAEIKARAVGRKRNGFGQAMGDVLLGEGETVVGLTRDSVATGLRHAGYRVATDASAASDPASAPLVLDVHIKKFWAWLQPGFWAVTVHADIATDLQFEGTGAPVVVSVPTQEGHQIVTDNVWIDAVNKALKEYVAQVTTAVTTTQGGKQAAK
jgi:hypothetical protein